MTNSRRGRDWFARARVARLATVTADGRPHLVPVVFVVAHDVGTDEAADVVWMAVDHKPKTTRALRRLANIEANPAVSLLVDHYVEDWSQLWWVRADGLATVVQAEDPRAAPALDALVGKYPQYAERVPPGPFIRVVVERWTAWSAAPPVNDEPRVSAAPSENT